MIELSKGGAYLVDGVDVIEESAAQQGALAARLGTDAPSKEEAAIVFLKVIIHRAIWTS